MRYFRCNSVSPTQGSLDSLEEMLTALNVAPPNASAISVIMCNYHDISKAIMSLDDGSHTPAYKNLEWRFQVKTSTRAVRNHLEPHVMLSLDLTNASGAQQTTKLTCTPDNLLHMRDVLEEALLEAKSQHMQKLTRQLK